MTESFKKERSPSCPKLPLSDALDLVRKLHAKAGRATIRPEVAIGPLGYSSLNGAALGTIAALTQYGLIERQRGSGLSVSPLALKLIHPLNDEQEKTARREAALNPRVFAEIYQGGYHDCSEDVLANHLIQNGFTPDGAKRAATVYRENSEYAALTSSEQHQPSSANGRAPSEIPASTGQPVTVDSIRNAAPSDTELPVPLDDGRIAHIPFPMSDDTFQLLIETLQLWKRRLVQETLEPDPTNPGWVKGFGVLRASPWHLAAVFRTKTKAEALQDQLGKDYEVAFGSNRKGSDDFIINRERTAK